MDGLPYELPEYVSPSSLATYSQCPLKYKYSRVNKIQEPPTQSTLLGNFVHDVLESFYGTPDASRRTVSSLRSLSSAVWADEKWAEKIKGTVPDREAQKFRWSAWWCLENIFRIEDPTKIIVSGVETELDGTVDDVRVKGFIDRWFVEGGVACISDYKTGKTPRDRYLDDKFVQLVIYAILLPGISKNPVGTVELLYLKDGKRFYRNIGTSDIDSVRKMITDTHDAITSSYRENNWPAKPSKLCDWCYFKHSICEYWRKDKA